MRSDELERKRVVEAGGSVVANVRKIKGQRADEDLIRRAEESGRFIYIGDAVRHTSVHLGLIQPRVEKRIMTRRLPIP